VRSLTAIPEPVSQRSRNFVYSKLADAFKHHKLDRPNATVDGADAIIMTGTGWGKLRWGEGKWGGAELVIVERKTATSAPYRPLCKTSSMHG
jgi:hypothetical protein